MLYFELCKKKLFFYLIKKRLCCYFKCNNAYLLIFSNFAVWVIFVNSMRKLFFSIFLLFMLLLTACGGERSFRLDKKELTENVKVHRFDLDMLSVEKEGTATLYEKHPQFLSLFVEHFDTVQFSDTLVVEQLLREIVEHPMSVELNEEISEKLSDVSTLEKELSTAYSYLAHYFPNVKRPDVYLFSSGLREQLITSPSMEIIGIASDFYLGSEFEMYQSLVYDYMIEKMRPEQLGIDLLSHLLFSTFRFDGKENRLLDMMLYRGKLLYLQCVMMPERAEREVLSYSVNEEKWAQKYEKEIWRGMAGSKDLFSSDQFLIRKYMEEAPFTVPVSPDSPGRLGEWVGLQIVKSFMKNNKDVGLQELMMLGDYQEMLMRSGY